MRRRLAARGMTLLEVMVVTVIVALLTSAVIVGSGQTANARLKRTATMITGAVRMAMTRASITSKSQRIVMDMDNQTMWLEEATLPMLVAPGKGAAGGAEAATDVEAKAIAESERIVKGPQAPRARFTPVSGIGAQSIEGTKGPRPLERGIKFRSVETAHDPDARTSGRAYLYFWPGGQTERGVVQLRIGDSTEDDKTLSLVIAPLTGKVNVKAGPAPLVRPTDDRSASEREDTGGSL